MRHYRSTATGQYGQFHGSQGSYKNKALCVVRDLKGGRYEH